jgi:hypothetical protein
MAVRQVQSDKKKCLASMDRKRAERQALKTKLDEEKQKTYGNYQGTSTYLTRFALASCFRR